MNTRTFCILTILLIVTNVSAQPTEPDVVGVWFDEGAVTDCLDSATPGTQVTAYLTLCNASADGVLGWECQLEFVSGRDELVVLDWAPRGSVLSESTPPVFTVGLADLLPWAETIVLMDVRILWGGDHCWFYLGPNPIPTIIAEMAYTDTVNPVDIRVMHHAAGDPELPVARISTNCAVSVEGTAWGAVKRLYR